MTLSLKKIASDKISDLPTSYSVTLKLFGLSSVLPGTTLSITEKLEELDDMTVAGNFYIEYTSMECHAESIDGLTASDEVYCLFVTAGWGPEGDAPWVSVQITKTYLSVDVTTEWHADVSWDEVKIYTTEVGDKPGAHHAADNRDIWGNASAYDPMKISQQVILAQAMEHDYSKPELIRKTLEVTMLGRLMRLLRERPRASRKEIIDTMKKQMADTIDDVRISKARVFTDEEIAELKKQLYEALETDQNSTTEHGEEETSPPLQSEEEQGEDQGNTLFDEIVEEIVKWALVEILEEILENMKNADDRTGRVKQFVISTPMLEEAITGETIRRSLMFDGTDDLEGKYEFKFSVKGESLN